jgi:predicted transcriptional regulator of viral defense system
LQNYLKRGYLKRVKRNLYVAIDLVTHAPVVNKYRIAGMITPSAYVSHHAAFDYYGLANQVSYAVNVSSETVFSSFDFEGISYDYLKSRLASGIVVERDHVRVTDMERTVLDNINDFEKVMGLEEMLRCLSLVPTVKEAKLLSYLNEYSNHSLYQKTGYLLEHFRDGLYLSDAFFDECLKGAGNNKSYLYRSPSPFDMVYNKKWRLIVPENLSDLTSEAGEDIAI